VTDHGGTPHGNAVEVRFEAVVGAQPFSCFVEHPFAGLGMAASAWTPLDFRLYVHDVQLVPESGAPVSVTLDQDGTWQYRNVALLDFETANGSCANGTAPTNTAVRGRVNAPAGTRWTGLRFKLGVPQSLNHQNPATRAVAAQPLHALLGLAERVQVRPHRRPQRDEPTRSTSTSAAPGARATRWRARSPAPRPTAPSTC
jgi:hypothetical protein